MYRLFSEAMATNSLYSILLAMLFHDTSTQMDRHAVLMERAVVWNTTVTMATWSSALVLDNGTCL